MVANTGHGGVDIVETDIYTTVRTEYGATSTVTGWTSFTNKKIYYKQIGKRIFVDYLITGTSDATTVSFTLPTAAANLTIYFGQPMTYAVDNGTILTGAGRCILTPNTSTVQCFTDMSSGAWTNSGDKQVWGSFSYEIA